MIELQGVSYSVGDFALDNISMTVEAGEYFVLLGKPGSGKTLLLECIAGLRPISAGNILISGRTVTAAEPAHRGVGYVPQDYALFTTRTVAENIAFALRVRRIAAHELQRRVAELASMLSITHLLGRSVGGLSGGERQRVALARALAAQPSVLLLDEPVSALDTQTRAEILAELKRLQRTTRTTFIHVCHDLDEMRSVADRVGILSNGRLLQVDTPDAIAAHPNHPEVARILDLGVVLTAQVSPGDTGARLDLGGPSLPLPISANAPTSVLLRADAIRLLPAPEGASLQGTIKAVLRRDVSATVEVQVGSVLLRAKLEAAAARRLPLEPDAPVGVLIPAEAIYIFPSSGR